MGSVIDGFEIGRIIRVPITGEPGASWVRINRPGKSDAVWTQRETRGMSQIGWLLQVCRTQTIGRDALLTPPLEISEEIHRVGARAAKTMLYTGKQKQSKKLLGGLTPAHRA